ncbi:MAG: S49 family peptidase, partial [Candidatus Rokubacteria bacterium]|nr:S49 family peptidase [Candidatus Rokubacteria bacterium]
MRHALAALVAALVLAGCSVVSIDLTPRVRPLEESTVEGSAPDKVLLVDLSGVLAEEPLLTLETRPSVPLLARVREELEKAEEDARVRAVVLRINSPGGTVTASDILYHEITRFKERRKIPVVACILDVGASGGYYVALAADRIVVHPTTVTGSIGVLMLTVNASGLLEKIGVSASY